MKLSHKFICILFFSFSLSNINAQKTSFGIGSGLLNGSERATANNGSATASDTGFYIGLFSDLKMSDKFKLRGELDYGNLGETSFGFASIQVKYYPTKKLYAQIGPQVSHIFNQLGSTLKDTGMDLSIGAGYDITENFHIQARYGLNLTDRNNTGFDQTSKLRWVFVGIEYSFNL